MGDYGEYEVEGYEYFVPTGASEDSNDIVGFGKREGTKSSFFDGIWYKPNGKIKTVIGGATKTDDPYIPHGINSDATHACGSIRKDGPTSGFIFKKSNEDIIEFRYNPTEFDHTRALGINKDEIIVGEVFKPVSKDSDVTLNAFNPYGCKGIDDSRGFIWDETNGFTVLQYPRANQYTRFVSIDDDGVITGTADGWQLFLYYPDTETWESIIPGPEKAGEEQGDEFIDDEYMSSNILKDVSMNKHIDGIQKGFVRYGDGHGEVISVPGKENAIHVVGGINAGRTVIGMVDDEGEYKSFFKTHPQYVEFSGYLFRIFVDRDNAMSLHLAGTTGDIDGLELEDGMEIPVETTIEFKVPPFVLDNSKRLVLKSEVTLVARSSPYGSFYLVPLRKIDAGRKNTRG